ncbi:N6-L-threonylcarbamoyladenine synthase [Alternaria panax]|uniref:N6-L-threonylcarbamoyladenine synthase n=1 Tax=Alternaria panax TaxID=48097 RepID=A0AAD4FC34_9PLEO|nr:N6-L-threonylcarbamoyladenine synthase [Alternaria panax]
MHGVDASRHHHHISRIPATSAYLRGMRPRGNVFHAVVRPRTLHPPQWRPRRCLMTLAIETSCDDTSVAVIEKGTHHGRPVARLHFHKKVTSDNAIYQGVHPLVSLVSHQESLATLVHEAICALPMRDGHVPPDAHTTPTSAVDLAARKLPDFVSVTRGPGMRSNLFTGLDTAKGLAVAWQKPLVGVHHMQAHALTPRMVSALEAYPEPQDGDIRASPAETAPHNSTPAEVIPTFPFLSVLASGGHTLLIHSASLTDHRVLGSTNDIAVGECLDKIARVVLPAETLQISKSTMYGALLEAFALPDSLRTRPTSGNPSTAASKPSVYTAKTYLDAHRYQFSWYQVPTNHEDAMRKSATKWGWSLNRPLTKAGGGVKINSLELSFSGITTMVERIVRFGMHAVTRKFNKVERASVDVSIEERMDLARETMRAAFEHVASRVVLGLQSQQDVVAAPAVVMAGGVAANLFLRHM